MIHFNQQERLFILCVCTVLFLGSVIHYAFKTFPGLQKAIHVTDNKRFYPKTDINSANEQALVKIPYIGEYTAQRIIEYRALNGGFRSLEELKNVAGIRGKNFERFAPYLTVNPSTALRVK